MRFNKKIPLTCEKIPTLPELIYDFRHELARLKKKKLNYSLEDATSESNEMLAKDYELYITYQDEKAIAYALLRIFDATVWLEQIYVTKTERRSGIASELLDIANKRANDFGKETAFVNVHPNNDKMIKFLASNGYEVLNLLEIRKLYNKEKIASNIKVGNNSFLY